MNLENFEILKKNENFVFFKIPKFPNSKFSDFLATNPPCFSTVENKGGVVARNVTDGTHAQPFP